MRKRINVNASIKSKKKIEIITYEQNDCSIFYGTKEWIRLRKNQLMKEPLCEICKQHNRTTLAEEVHHKVPFLRGRDEDERWSLFLNENNLMSLCSHCHKKIHSLDKKKARVVLDSLTDEEFKNNGGIS